MEHIDWMDKEFIEPVLAHLQPWRKDPVNAISWTAQPAVNKGENYTSTLTRVVVQLDNEQETSFIVKSFPKGAIKSMVEDLGIWDKEETMFRTTLPLIHRLLKCKIAPEGLIFSGRRDIILEDLKAQGYKMTDRKQQLDFDHCAIALKTLAKFHAGSVGARDLDKSNIEFAGKELFFSENMRKEHLPFVRAPLVSLANEIENIVDCEGYARKLSDISELMWDKIVEATGPKAFNVLNHGDFWSNNIMFKYDKETGLVIEARLVDFQVCRLTTPAIDIHNFFISSVQEKVRETRWNELIDIYLECLNDTLEKLGQKLVPKEVLQKDLVTTEYFAIYASATALPSTLSDSENPLDLTESVFDDFISSDNTKNPFARTMKGKRYREIIPRLLESFDKKGLLNKELYINNNHK